jgi:hypothetical protein
MLALSMAEGGRRAFSGSMEEKARLMVVMVDIKGSGRVREAVERVEALELARHRHLDLSKPRMNNVFILSC